MKLEYYREVVQRIRSSGTDLIINLTCGPGGRFIPSDDDPAKPAPGTLFKTPEIRTEHIVELKPEICTLDLNTMWFGGGAVINTPRNLRIMAERMYAAGVKPELEVFDTGDLVMAQDLVADGTLKLPALFQIVTGIKYGMPSTPEAMLLAKSLLPQELRMGRVRRRPVCLPDAGAGLHPRRPLPHRHGGYRASRQGHADAQQCRAGGEGRAHHRRARRQDRHRRGGAQPARSASPHLIEPEPS